MKGKFWKFLLPLVILTMIASGLTACATPTPQVIREVVTQVVEVEKEVTRVVAGTTGVETVVVCAQTEMELQEWEAEDAAAYRADLGLAESGLQSLVRAGYRLLNLITFFTATGTKAVHAWAVPAGTAAPACAGRVHTDMEKGFIRAEVIHFEDLDREGSFSAVKGHGLLHVEGRDYVVQDGDVVHFRFNV